MHKELGPSYDTVIYKLANFTSVYVMITPNYYEAII